jgi:hypothetical protein
VLVILQWRILGGMDTSDPQAPKIVHAFMPRDSEGYSSKESWALCKFVAVKRR